MVPGDLAQALTLSESANWNQTAADWQRVLDLAESFCIELDGRIVASATAMVYGHRELAWIGMVLTLPEYRGRGLASTLVQASLDSCSDVACVKLDATEAGAPVYRKFGFEDECIVERWARPANAPAVLSDLTAGGEPDLALDRQAFGVDRSQLLASFPNTCAIDGAFLIHRPGRQAAQLGPCVAQSPELAESLAHWAVANCPQTPIFLDLFETHAAARNLAHSLRFAPARRLLRMSLAGKNIPQDPSLVYAMSGFEFG